MRAWTDYGLLESKGLMSTLSMLLLAGSLFVLAATSLSSIALLEGRRYLVPAWLAAILEQWPVSPALRPLILLLNVFAVLGTQALAFTILIGLDPTQDLPGAAILFLEMLAMGIFLGSVVWRWR